MQARIDLELLLARDIQIVVQGIEPGFRLVIADLPRSEWRQRCSLQTKMSVR
jgi:hypothetical protein